LAFGTHTLTVNSTLVSITGTASSTFSITDTANCDEGSLNDLCVINTIRGVLNNSVLNYTNLTIQNGGALRNQTLTAVFNISANNIIIEDGGRIEGNVNINASNLTILTGGLINLTGLGFAGATATNGNGLGPGGGEGVGSDGAQGAGYGGKGGVISLRL